MRFKLVRLVANSLPHRNINKLDALKFTLDNSFCPHNAEEVWVFNRLRSFTAEEKQETAAIRQLFDDREIPRYEIPFTKQAFIDAKHNYGKILAIAEINKVMNFCLEYCKPYDWLLFLSDTSYFNKELWDQTFSELCDFLANKNPKLKEFCVPVLRYKHPLPSNYRSIPESEPMMAFHVDSVTRYNPNLAFGRNCTVELLDQLGATCVETKTGPQTLMKKNNLLCPSLGAMFHVSFGPEILENSTHQRMDAREKGFRQVIAGIEKYFNQEV